MPAQARDAPFYHSLRRCLPYTWCMLSSALPLHTLLAFTVTPIGRLLASISRATSTPGLPELPAMPIPWKRGVEEKVVP